MRISDWSSDVCSSDLVQFAEPEDDSDNVELSYTVQVNGLSDADDSTDVDLADLFGDLSALYGGDGKADNAAMIRARLRSEEHTSELQSLMRISYAVFCLKKKTKIEKYILESEYNHYAHHQYIIKI